jgi:tetratricopeptide (TPR) repeat protein
MRSKVFVALLAASLLSVPPAALGNFSGGSKPDDIAPPSGVPEARTAPAMIPRQQAERTYADAYEDVAKAQKDLAQGKKKNADKKFKRAMERGETAAGLDSTYHEAWNLVGFCARNLGLYDRSLAAYDRCLAIAPDYAPAREYLGEAYVELGRISEAREQLARLERLKAEGEVKTLKARIDTWIAANPGAAAASPASVGVSTSAPAAPVDSAGAGSGGDKP